MKPSGKTCAAHFPVGEGDRAVRERHDAAVGDGDLEDRGGEVGEGRVAVGGGLAVDGPVGLPGQWIALSPQSSLLPIFFEESAVDRGEGLDGDKEVGSGRQPTTSVLRPSTAGDNVMDVGVVLELSTPGMQDPEKAGEVGANEPRVFREPFKG
jgi:hypothetical protein